MWPWCRHLPDDPAPGHGVGRLRPQGAWEIGHPPDAVCRALRRRWVVPDPTGSWIRPGVCDVKTTAYAGHGAEIGEDGIPLRRHHLDRTVLLLVALYACWG